MNQLLDKPLQLNFGKFRANGKCGYLLRPQFMFEQNFDPTKRDSLQSYGIKPIIVTLRVNIVDLFKSNYHNNKSHTVCSSGYCSSSSLEVWKQINYESLR